MASRGTYSRMALNSSNSNHSSLENASSRSGSSAPLSPEGPASVQASSMAYSSTFVDPGLASAGKGEAKDPFVHLGDDAGDDWLHDGIDLDKSTRKIDFRGFLNIGTLIVISAGLLMLFLGYPVLSIYLRDQAAVTTSQEVSSRTVFPPQLKRQLIDQDTPQDAYNHVGTLDSKRWHLVFSDEFNQEGRTFWPGDDPYWEAYSGWYSGTMDYEWYDPEALNTTNGYLQISFEERPTHGLNFRSGMLQSWNKVCFQGGYLEISARLPGKHNVAGFWPGLWTMGNLGRPGYGATNEGMWPYSYSSCDTGALPNQTFVNGTGPPKAVRADGQFSYQVNYALSYLPGMRFPACTCPGSEHPGPNRMVGRSAPEIDLLEAKIGPRGGQSSQSLQMAPFDIDYYYGNSTADGDVAIHDPATTELNDYHGNELQMAVSGLSDVPAYAYDMEPNARFTTFGLEWEPDWDGTGEGAYVTWYIDGKATWSVYGKSIGPVPELDIGQRLIPREPMSLIMNVAMAYNFQPPNFNELEYPGVMKIDYVRVYQIDGREDKVSCDPPDYPTKKYIEAHADLYDDNTILRFPKDRWPSNELQGC
ncbi:beta-glucan synthesis-associated protein [Thecaphora frezii]